MAHSAEERYARWRTTALIVWAVIGILVLLAAALWGLGRITDALVPFVIAFIIVFLLNRPVVELEKRGMKRGHAALLCLLIAVAVLGGVVTLLGPRLVHQLTLFTHSADYYLKRVQGAEAAVEASFSNLDLPSWLANSIQSASVPAGTSLLSFGDTAARTALSAGGLVARGMLDFFLSLIIAFWVLTDLPKLRSELILLAGPRYETDAEHLLATVTRVVGGYLRGQSIASLTTASISMVGLSLLHVPYALVIGSLAFFFNFAPYVGPVTIGITAGLLGMFVSPLTSLLAVCVVIVAQTITDYLVVPRVMSSQVDLHPTLVIFSLLVGSALFGVPGLLFAIPVAAVAKGLFVYYYERRTERSLSTTDGALFRHSSRHAAAEHKPATKAAEPVLPAENAENAE